MSNVEDKTIQKLTSVIVCMQREINRLTEIVEARTSNNDLAVKIIEYFHRCRSIKKTAYKYDLDPVDLFHQIPEWDRGCREALENADDYLEYSIEANGRNQCDEEYNEYSLEELVERKRTPETMDEILADYIRGKLSLYEIADKHYLWINNLFRLLNENGVIDDETDARGYGDFYAEYVGGNVVWNGVNSLDLIKQFYLSK
jgi:hypothetical protein